MYLKSTAYNLKGAIFNFVMISYNRYQEKVISVIMADKKCFFSACNTPGRKEGDWEPVGLERNEAHSPTLHTLSVLFF